MFSPLWYQYGIVYSAVWLTFFGLWFSLMRLVAYGVAINAVVHYKVDDSISSPSEVVNKAVSGAIDGGEKVLFLIPLKWFMRRGYQRWGAVICIIIAIVTTWFLWLLEPFV
jgi:hypothetical protein